MFSYTRIESVVYLVQSKVQTQDEENAKFYMQMKRKAKPILVPMQQCEAKASQGRDVKLFTLRRIKTLGGEQNLKKMKKEIECEVNAQISSIKIARINVLPSTIECVCFVYTSQMLSILNQFVVHDFVFLWCCKPWEFKSISLKVSRKVIHRVKALDLLNINWPPI